MFTQKNAMIMDHFLTYTVIKLIYIYVSMKHYVSI